MGFLPVRAAASKIILSIHTPPRLDGSAPMLGLFLQVSAPSSCARARAWPATRSGTLPSFVRRRSQRTSLDRFPVWRQNRFHAASGRVSHHLAQHCPSPLPPLLLLPP